MNKLYELRKEKGVRQIDIANILEVSKQCYSNYEKGLREPDNATLQKLSEFFGVSIDYILGATDIRTILPSDTPLTTEEKLLLDLFAKVPEDKQKLVLQMIKAALE